MKKLLRFIEKDIWKNGIITLDVVSNELNDQMNDEIDDQVNLNSGIEKFNNSTKPKVKEKKE